MGNVVGLACGFFLLFFAFFAAQNYVTSALGSPTGDISLALIYGTLALGALLSPALLSRWSSVPGLHAERWALTLGAGLYAPFLLACASPWPAVQLVCSVILGAGAAVLWVAQGSVLTAASHKDHRDRDAGIFWAGYMSGNACGNLAAYLISATLNQRLLFALLAAVALSGSAACYLLISPLAEPGAEPPIERLGVCQGLADTLAALRERPVLVLLPALCLVGYENSFWAGELTQLLPEKKIGLVLAGLGLAEVCAGAAAGALKRLLGLRGLVGLCGCSFGVALWLSARLKQQAAGGRVGLSWEPFVAAGCFGLGDGWLNTVLIARLGHLSDDLGLFHRRTAFVVFQAVNTVFNALGFAISPLLPMHGPHGSLAQVWLVTGLAGVGLGLLMIPEPLTGQGDSDAADGRLEPVLGSDSAAAKRLLTKEAAID